MNELRVGTATRDITPYKPVWLSGYGNRYHKSKGVLEPITIGCLAIKSDKKTVLIVTYDLLGIDEVFSNKLCRIIKEKTGIAFQDIMISCSHTHFSGITHPTLIAAPPPEKTDSNIPTPVKQCGYAELDDIGFVYPDDSFINDIIKKTEEIAEESLTALVPCVLETAKLNIEQITYNRRTRKPDGTVVTNVLYPDEPDEYIFQPFDPEMTVLRFVNSQGVKAVLLNYGCHPVAGGYDQQKGHYMISSDYPYYARKTIEESYHCPVFFTLGAAGDTVPLNRFKDSRKQLGNILGNSAILAERVFKPCKSHTIYTDIIDIEVETLIETSDSAKADYKESYRKIITFLKNRNADIASPEYNDLYSDFNMKALLLKRHKLYPDNSHTVRIQFFTIGNLTIIGIPFEVLSEISIRIKAKYPNCLIVSCTGGYYDYLPLEHEFSRGGYEIHISSANFKENTADRLLEAIMTKLRTLFPQKNEYHGSQHPCKS